MREYWRRWRRRSKRSSGPNPYMADHVARLVSSLPDGAPCPHFGSDDVGGNGYWTTDEHGRWRHHDRTRYLLGARKTTDA